MITIDGSQGEGGGQILRTALGLSLVTGTPFRIDAIRAKRSKPGLLRQHLTAVNAAVKIGNAEADGASIGSARLDFKPGTVTPGTYAFAIGTAGSATLVLQTVLPALLRASGPSTLTLEGGTHNPFAPPYDFLDRAFLPLINRMGPRVTTELERPGFYPAGGGKFTVSITPAAKLERLDLRERGEDTGRKARAVIAHLPVNVAERELRIVKEKLAWPDDCLKVETANKSTGPGNILLLEIQNQHVTEVFTGFGEKERPAEEVAQMAVNEARAYLASGVPVGPHLADQLLIPLALAGGGSFVTGPLSEHAKTNIDVVERFLGVKFTVTEITPRSFLVEV